VAATAGVFYYRAAPVGQRRASASQEVEAEVFPAAGAEVFPADGDL